jgi:hypothetical protein
LDCIKLKRKRCSLLSELLEMKRSTGEVLGWELLVAVDDEADPEAWVGVRTLRGEDLETGDEGVGELPNSEGIAEFSNIEEWRLGELTG